jgi:F-type H+-transporting ATPase subunit b
MLIDWFTVAAQIVNFLILLWLLKKFLYGRILRAIDERERRIAARLADAEAREKEAAEQLAVYEAKRRELEQNRDALLAEAKRDAEQQHAELLDQARQHVRSLETKWQQELDRERDQFLLDLRRRAATEVIGIARRAMADLACVEVQRCAVAVFLEKVRSLDSDARKNLAKGELAIRTAVDLGEAETAEIRQIIEAWLESPVSLRFERAPGLGLGLELRGNGWRIGWNSESYLDALQQELKEMIDQGAHPGDRAEKVSA